MTPRTFVTALCAILAMLAITMADSHGRVARAAGHYRLRARLQFVGTQLVFQAGSGL